MNDSQLFFILTVIVFIIICVLVNDPLDVIICVSALAGAMFYFRDRVSMTYTKGAKKESDTGANADANASANTDTKAADAPKDQNPNLRYGVDQREYDAYINTYANTPAQAQPVTYNGTDIDCSMDANMALIGQKRARDKRAIDGAVIKDANFYRHHFGDELDKTEKRVWWGESEL
jgi:hypothetical protein